MIPHDLLRQVRRLHIQAKRAVEGLLGGEYHSVFKGAGIAFEEVREYQAGDDIRSIDWNVTARTGHPFIKRYVEERELTAMLVIDGSASQYFGSGMLQKRRVVAEIAALLAFSAISNNDRVGLLQFTDEVESFLPPRKGTRHVLRMVRDILLFRPKSYQTSISKALDFVNKVLHRRAIIFLLSDFLDDGFADVLKRTGRRHDVIAIRVTDSRELSMPNVGLVTFEDAETGEQLLVDTRKATFRADFHKRMQESRDELQKIARSGQIDWLEMSTDGNHVATLRRFFEMRERRRHRP